MEGSERRRKRRFFLSGLSFSGLSSRLSRRTVATSVDAERVRVWTLTEYVLRCEATLEMLAEEAAGGAMTLLIGCAGRYQSLT